MRKLTIKLTPNQLNIVTTALFEYENLCESDAPWASGGVNGRLTKLARSLGKVRHAINKQENKQLAAAGQPQRLGKTKIYRKNK